MNSKMTESPCQYNFSAHIFNLLSKIQNFIYNITAILLKIIIYCSESTETIPKHDRWTEGLRVFGIPRMIVARDIYVIGVGGTYRRT